MTTIIVLLILAGVTIATLVGENGLLGRASRAGEENKKAEALENLKIKIIEVQAEKNGNATLQDFVEYLQNDTTATYTISLEKTSNINGTLPDGIDTKDEIYVKYNGFEFKVSKNLTVELVGGNETENNSSDSSDGSSESGSNPSGNTQTGSGQGTGRTESNLITSVTASNEIHSNNIKFTISSTTVDNAEVKGYLVYCENRLYDIIKTNEITIRNLTKNTWYNIYFEALDEYGNSKKSENLRLQTSNAEYTIADYIVITGDGFKIKMENVDDSTDYYYDDIDFSADYSSILANNAITPKTFDGDDTTKDGPYSATTICIEIDSSAWGKTLKVTKVSGYQWISFQNSQNGGIGGNWASGDRNTSHSIVIPENAVKLSYYLNEGGCLYEMSIE